MSFRSSPLRAQCGPPLTKARICTEATAGLCCHRDPVPTQTSGACFPQAGGYTQWALKPPPPLAERPRLFVTNQ